MKFSDIVWRLRRILKSRNRILELSNCRKGDFSLVQKGRLRRLLELTYIAARWDEYSTAYYAQGMDRKGRSVLRDFLPLGKFNEFRAQWNSNPLYPKSDYSALFEDKLFFERFFGGQNLPVVRSYGLLMPGQMFVGWKHGKVPLVSGLLPFEFLDAFCKPLAGRYGRGAVRLEQRDGRLYVNGLERKGFLNESLGYPFIVQERIVQHPEIAAFHVSSLNTFRIVTFVDREGEPALFGGFFRMGVAGSVVDNASSGGVVCGFDPALGVLNEAGWRIGKTNFESIATHPTSGEKFSAKKVPFMKEVVELALNAHRFTPWIRSVGWDIAVRDDGPVLIEGNERWGPLSLMWVDRGFVGRVSSLMNIR